MEVDRDSDEETTVVKQKIEERPKRSTIYGIQHINNGTNTKNWRLIL